MINCSVDFVLGLNGPTLHSITLPLNAATVGGACHTHGTLHILKMGRHFDHYYDGQVYVALNSAANIYSKPVFSFHTKAKSREVKGQVGESIGSLVMRYIGLSTSDLEPLLVDGNRKTPDFKVNWHSAGALLGNRVSTLPTEWPLECKSRPTQKTPTQEAFFAALPQLATYWLYRGVQAPKTIGFGLICVSYNSMMNATMHVILPKNKGQLDKIIKDTLEAPKNLLEDYQDQFTRPSDLVRDALSNCEGGI